VTPGGGSNLFWLELCNQPLGAPNLNGAAIQQPLGSLDCLVIGIANNRLESDEMPVGPDRESPVFCHPKVP
jgi:hypothetical protein